MTKLEKKESNQIGVKERIRVKPPAMYKVLLLNDDITTMEFVVNVLEQVFNKQAHEAVKIMLQVHQQGQGLCGIYSKEIAETKCKQVKSMAEINGYPLRCLMELE